MPRCQQQGMCVCVCVRCGIARVMFVRLHHMFAPAQIVLLQSLSVSVT